MDDKSLHRRQNDPSYNLSDSRFNPENQGRGFTGNTSERLRPAPPNTSPSTSRRAQPYPTFYHMSSPSFPTGLQSGNLQTGSLQPSNLQYHSDPSYVQDQRQQQQQQQQQQSFAAYTPDLMYGNVYNQASQFQARQSGAMQLIPDVSAPYFPTDSAPTPEATSLQTHDTSTAISSVYSSHQQQHNPGVRTPLIHQNYSAMPASNIPQSAEVMEEQVYQPQTSGMETAYANYQSQLKAAFGHITKGCLGEAGTVITELSDWLLTHVVDLGLTVDEVSLHADRIQLWGEFNGVWLGLLQKQKDLLESGLRVTPPQNLITQENISAMAKNLIRLCDMIEKYGLVDYQYGVAEEQIITILMECLDLQESIEKNTQTSSDQSSNNRGPS